MEDLGDAYETVEEMYGMIWWLATRLAKAENTPVAAIVEAARQQSAEGLSESPGTAGELPVDE